MQVGLQNNVYEYIYTHIECMVFGKYTYLIHSTYHL
jgi:hypothetical protein